MSTACIFREPITFNPNMLRFGIQSESHLRNLFKLVEEDFSKIYLIYTPLRTGDDLCYDVVGVNHAELDDAMVFINQNLIRKWKNLMSI